MEIISRFDAKQQKLKSFYTGVPCVNNHNSERYVSTGACIECQQQRMRDYQRLHSTENVARVANWAAKNKEKRKEYLRKQDKKRSEEKHKYLDNFIEKIYNVHNLY